jgi:hypothetical protein
MRFALRAACFALRLLVALHTLPCAAANTSIVRPIPIGNANLRAAIRNPHRASYMPRYQSVAPGPSHAAPSSSHAAPLVRTTARAGAPSFGAYSIPGATPHGQSATRIAHITQIIDGASPFLALPLHCASCVQK